MDGIEAMLAEKQRQIAKMREEVATTCNNELQTLRQNLRDYTLTVSSECKSAMLQSERKALDLRAVILSASLTALVVGLLLGGLIGRAWNKATISRLQMWQVPQARRFQQGQVQFVIVSETEVMQAPRNAQGYRYVRIFPTNGGK